MYITTKMFVGVFGVRQVIYLLEPNGPQGSQSDNIESKADSLEPAAPRCCTRREVCCFHIKEKNTQKKYSV